MNKAKLKSYAPQARKDFIAAVTARANLLGTVLLPLPLGEGRGEGCPRVNDFSDDDLFPGTHPQISLGEYLPPSPGAGVFAGCLGGWFGCGCGCGYG